MKIKLIIYNLDTSAVFQKKWWSKRRIGGLVSCQNEIETSLAGVRRIL